MGLQGLGINPGLGEPKRSRPAVGDQMQGADGLTSLALLAEPFADPLQGMLVLRAVQGLQLRPCHQGLNLRTALICHQALLCGRELNQRRRNRCEGRRRQHHNTEGSDTFDL